MFNQTMKIVQIEREWIPPDTVRGNRRSKNIRYLNAEYQKMVQAGRGAILELFEKYGEEHFPLRVPLGIYTEFWVPRVIDANNLDFGLKGFEDGLQDYKVKGTTEKLPGIMKNDSEIVERLVRRYKGEPKFRMRIYELPADYQEWVPGSFLRGEI